MSVIRLPSVKGALRPHEDEFTCHKKHYSVCQDSCVTSSVAVEGADFKSEKMENDPDGVIGN